MSNLDFEVKGISEEDTKKLEELFSEYFDNGIENSKEINSIINKITRGDKEKYDKLLASCTIMLLPKYLQKEFKDCNLHLTYSSVYRGNKEGYYIEKSEKDIICNGTHCKNKMRVVFFETDSFIKDLSKMLLSIKTQMDLYITSLLSKIEAKILYRDRYKRIYELDDIKKFLKLNGKSTLLTHEPKKLLGSGYEDIHKLYSDTKYEIQVYKIANCIASPPFDNVKYNFIANNFNVNINIDFGYSNIMNYTSHDTGFTTSSLVLPYDLSIYMDKDTILFKRDVAEITPTEYCD